MKIIILNALVILSLLPAARAQAESDFGPSYFTNNAPMALMEPVGDSDGIGSVTDAAMDEMAAGVLAQELQGISPAAGDVADEEFDILWPPELEFLPLPLPLE